MKFMWQKNKFSSNAIANVKKVKNVEGVKSLKPIDLVGNKLYKIIVE